MQKCFAPFLWETNNIQGTLGAQLGIFTASRKHSMREEKEATEEEAAE